MEPERRGRLRSAICHRLHGLTLISVKIRVICGKMLPGIAFRYNIIRIFYLNTRIMTTKLTLTVEKEVIERAKSYAKHSGRSLSELIEQYLRAV